MGHSKQHHKKTEDNKNVQKLLVSCVTHNISLKKCQQIVPNISKREYTASKIQREIFLNPTSQPKPHRVLSTVSNSAIEFAIDSFAHLRHINAFSTTVLKTPRGGEYVSTCFRDSSITHIYNEYRKKCNLATKIPMSKFSFTKIVYLLCKKKSKLLACQDTLLSQNLLETTADITHVISCNLSLFPHHVSVFFYFFLNFTVPNNSCILLF